jgi:hypothetical protein
MWMSQSLLNDDGVSNVKRQNYVGRVETLLEGRSVYPFLHGRVILTRI